ncbi:MULTISPECIES: hypothetical protein [unclassified Nocardiopsis]|uniref:hypothetical protein n=1 Tax=unclassified Nocardiopsis TaxID=2649073 RepID=UPI0033E5C171
MASAQPAAADPQDCVDVLRSYLDRVTEDHKQACRLGGGIGGGTGACQSQLRDLGVSEWLVREACAAA